MCIQAFGMKSTHFVQKLLSFIEPCVIRNKFPKQFSQLSGTILRDKYFIPYFNSKFEYFTQSLQKYDVLLHNNNNNNHTVKYNI